MLYCGGRAECSGAPTRYNWLTDDSSSGEVTEPMKRRDFLYASALGALGAAWSPRAWAFGDDARFSIAHLAQAKSGWDTRPTALRRLLQEVEKRTSVTVRAEVEHVRVGPAMFDHPMLVMSGERGFEPWPAEHIDQLRTWLKAGGFLVVDSSEGVPDGPFIQSARRELDRVFAGEPARAIPSDHVLYRSFYLLDEPYGRLIVDDELTGYFENDRVPVVISTNDLLGAWARDGFGRWEFDVVPGGEKQREMAFRMGINLVMYALCVNYKADQVHIPFILKRRKWKVD